MELVLHPHHLRAYTPPDPETHVELKAKVFNARAGLVEADPFLGSLVLKLPISLTEDPRNPTACVDASGACHFDAAFLKALSGPEIRSVLLHETLHLALDAFGRQGDRDPRGWNIAHDFAINLLIQASALNKGQAAWPKEFPPLLDPQFQGLSAEQIYDRIIVLKDLPNGGVSDLWEGPEGRRPTPEELAALRERWREALVDAAEQALRTKNWNDLPAWVQKLLEPILKPQIPWQQALAHRVHGHIRGRRRSFSHPGRRSAAVGATLPGPRHDQGVAGVFIDVSGSIGALELGLFLGELRSILQDADLPVRLLTWDAEVKEDLFFEEASTLTDALLSRELRWVGGGGTDPGCLLPHLAGAQDHPSPTFGILLTDGYCAWPSPRDWPFELMVVSTEAVPPEGYEHFPLRLSPSTT